MTEKPCNCNHAAKPLPTNESEKFKKKTRAGFTGYMKMAVPAFLFIIIPKCPVCLAGYIALVSGVSLSLPAATYIRIGLVTLCVLSLTWFIIKHVKKHVVHKQH